MTRATTQPMLLPDPAEARVWRPRLLLVLAAATTIVGAFEPWLAGRLSGDSAGVSLGGDGWILVVAAAFAMAPALLGGVRGAIGMWVVLNAIVGGFVCAVHSQQAQTDGFRNGWGLYIASAGCAALAVAGLQWLRAASRD
jgi:hypothetical protein